MDSEMRQAIRTIQRAGINLVPAPPEALIGVLRYEARRGLHPAREWLDQLGVEWVWKTRCTHMGPSLVSRSQCILSEHNDDRPHAF